MAVTKTRPPEEILLLRDAGVTEIGENRVQELKAKLPVLEGAFRIHLIGRLQRNKVRQVIGDVCMIQSVDSVPLAEEISRRAAAAGLRSFHLRFPEVYRASARLSSVRTAGPSVLRTGRPAGSLRYIPSRPVCPGYSLG